MHTPKQKRSIITREKILKIALQLFCKNGYYKTSTNEIAQTANISIGNLYFYFKDKDMIFFEILNRYNQSFIKIHEKISKEMENYHGERKVLLRKLMEIMVQNHEISKELNREIHILCFSNPKVAAVMEKQQEQIEKIVMNYLLQYKEQIKVQDIAAAATVTFALLDSVVNLITFSKSKIDRKRILTEAVNAVDKYLFGEIH